jgi:hypothetical protein
VVPTTFTWIAQAAGVAIRGDAAPLLSDRPATQHRAPRVRAERAYSHVHF